MKQVRLLSVSFDAEIAHYETAAFRGAIIEKVGQERELYHNHNNAPDAKAPYHYRYPLVQYKRQRKKPSIVFIEKGVNEAQYFFAQPNWELNFAGKAYQATVSDFKVRKYDVGVVEQEKYYTLRRWAALNQDNFARYIKLESDEKRKQFLERVLVGHILSFGKGINYRYQRKFDLEITEILKEQIIPFERVSFMTFDIRFKANISLPNLISLGKGAARGYGILSYWNPKWEKRKS